MVTNRFNQLANAFRMCRPAFATIILFLTLFTMTSCLQRYDPLDSGESEYNKNNNINHHKFMLAKRTLSARLPMRYHVIRTNNPNSRLRRAEEEKTEAVCTEEQMLKADGLTKELLLAVLLDGPEPVTETDKLTKNEHASKKNCSTLGRRKSKGKRQPIEIKPDMPLEMRAMCPFERTVNFDGQRLPKSIPEVRCLCPQPPHTHPLLAEQFSCEPLYYDIQVLKFESNCRKFRPSIERISLGCVATRKPHTRSAFGMEMGRPVEEENLPLEEAIR